MVADNSHPPFHNSFWHLFQPSIDRCLRWEGFRFFRWGKLPNAESFKIYSFYSVGASFSPFFTESELHKIKHLPNDIQKAICEDISVLDNCYGKDRNIDADMGGFVVVCNANEELNIQNFNNNFEHPEFTQRICPYTKKLYISGTERNIIIYERDL